MFSDSKSADKPGSVTASLERFAMTAIPLGAPLPARSSHLPADVTRAASMSAYLVLLRMEVAAFHPLPAKEATRLCGPVPRLRRTLSRRLIASGRYPASCSAEPGLSSPPSACASGAATVWLASKRLGYHSPAQRFAGTKRHDCFPVRREVCRNSPRRAFERHGVAVLRQAVERRTMNARESFEAVKRAGIVEAFR